MDDFVYDRENAEELPMDADAPERRKEPTPLKQSIDRVLAKYNVVVDSFTDDLVHDWPSVVSPELAKLVRPGKYANGFLYLYVQTSMQQYQIRQFRMREIEKALAPYDTPLHPIRQIRLMIQPDKTTRGDCAQ